MESLEADLFFVCGTSLGVAPANMTVMHANNYRVLCNREKVGQNLGMFSNRNTSNTDFFLDGDCDDTFIELAKACGWTEDLLKFVD